VAGSRLTREQCQEIADLTARSLESLGAAEALAGFTVGDGHVDEVVTDERTGKSFRRMIFASPMGESGVALTVTVSPEPGVVRHARRLKLIAELAEGWRHARETGQSTRLLER
jgi:hypothetical protein